MGVGGELDGGVAELPLDVDRALALLEQERGEGVPEGVGREVRRRGIPPRATAGNGAPSQPAVWISKASIKASGVTTRTASRRSSRWWRTGSSPILAGA